ncbi:hypothetical protein QFZ58_002071 [Streptomyces sp. B1I3]|nr:hypothetical protein [Streptomyces sp. B1I3]
MSETIHARINMALLAGEYWWTVSDAEGALYAYGWSLDHKKARTDAKAKAQELVP